MSFVGAGCILGVLADGMPDPPHLPDRRKTSHAPLMATSIHDKDKHDPGISRHSAIVDESTVIASSHRDAA